MKTKQPLYVNKTNQKIFGVSFPPLLLEQLDVVRGDIPRSTYIQRLVEKNLQEIRNYG